MDSILSEAKPEKTTRAGRALKGDIILCSEGLETRLSMIRRLDFHWLLDKLLDKEAHNRTRSLISCFQQEPRTICTLASLQRSPMVVGDEPDSLSRLGAVPQVLNSGSSPRAQSDAELLRKVAVKPLKSTHARAREELTRGTRAWTTQHTCMRKGFLSHIVWHHVGILSHAFSALCFQP